MFPLSGSDAVRHGFTSTQWSVVLAARDASSGPARTALSTLCSTYWRPLYLYVRRSGHSIEDAQDLTQSFFARLLEKDSLQHVDPALGKFRAFLLASLKNFLTNEWRRSQTVKRGAGVNLISLADLTQAENVITADSSLTPEQLYQRNWALSLLNHATTRLESEFAAAGKTQLFQTLKPYLTGDAHARYAEAAAALGMSEVTVRVSVHRMRGRFRDLLQQEVAQTLDDPSDHGAIAQELRFLLTVL